jgi:hypothetical protein
MGLHEKCPLFLSDINETSVSRRIFFNAQMPNLKKIRSMGAELLLAEGQADMTKLLAAFNNFLNAPNKIIIIIK